jgi:DGQHR domain-containing protein
MDTLKTDIDELYEREAKDKRVLAQLIERYSNQQGKYLATRGEMGVHTTTGGKQFRTPSFVVSHDLNWISINLKMGSEMPLMQQYIDKETGKLRIDESNVDEIMQRQPDWSRQVALTAYLASDKMRKFGTILAVISPTWVDNPQHENWGKDGRALKSAAHFEALDASGRIGLLTLDDFLLYALDGQHRVMGLRGIRELIENTFKMRKSNGDQVKRIPREEFLSQLGLDFSILQSMLSERMHVEYIPAVLPGETREEASRRVRSVFVAINSHAKKPTKGENYVLDEVGGYSIVARRVGVRHPLLKGTAGSRINWKGSALPERSEWYTTLEALREMTEEYVGKANPEIAKSWAPKFGGTYLRPQENELEAARDQMDAFLDQVAALPIFENLARSKDLHKELSDYRAFPEDDTPNSHGHLLLRPIGQIVLAAAVGRLLDPTASDRMSLDQVFAAIRTLDRNGRFEAHRPQNVWYGVTYNFHKNKMDVSVSHRELAVKLLMYLVRGAAEEERDNLLREVIAKREIEGKWRPFSGGDSVDVRRDAEGKVDIRGISLPKPRE